MSLLLLLRRGAGVTQPDPGIAITLTRAWLHSVPDYSDNIELEDATAVDPSRATLGETRLYAAGNRGIVGRPGLDSSLAVSCTALSLAQYADLERREGTVQMWRDPHGRLMHGVYNDLKGHDWISNELMDATFTFQEITWAEGE